MSSFHLTNQMVVERCQALFASTKATYNFPNVNREVSRHQLVQHIKTDLPTVAYISDFQGAGKSTLMEMVVNTFGFRSDRTAMVRVRDVTLTRLEEDLQSYNTLFVDDVDIRTSWKKILDGLKLLQGFGAVHQRPIVVCGDFTIRNEEIRQIFDPIPHADITMEPVDRRFLLEALNYRIRYLFPKNKEAVPDDGNLIYDEELLECLVPDSAIPVATFREVLTLSEGLAYEVEPTDEEFRLTKTQAAQYCKTHPLYGPTDEQKTFLKFWLKPYVTETHPRGKGMKPFSPEQVLDNGQIEGVSDPATLIELVLEPLCTGGILHALGVPSFRDGKFTRYPGPYLPRPTFLLHAYAGTEDWALETG